MQPSFAQLSFRNKKRELFQMRNQRFNRKRNPDRQMEQEAAIENAQSIQDVDYWHLYPEDVRAQLDLSLKQALPSQLPPLDLHTIALYRRSGKAVYQTRRMGSKEIDPHMAYQSLLILGHNDAKQFGNWSALVKEFQRDFRLFLNAESRDIREMAIIAAGNKIIGKEADVLSLIKENDLTFLWVLINHTYQNKISSRYLLPFLLKKIELAFKAFSEMTGLMRDQSIMILMESDEAIDCLMEVIDCPGPLCKLSLKIISNILGQGQGHWKCFFLSKLLDKSLNLLCCGDASLKIILVEMLCSFVCQPEAATAVLRHEGLMAFLVNLLSNMGSYSIQLRRELLNTFSFIVYKAQPEEVFQRLMSGDLMEICSSMLGMNEELSIGALQLICGLVELGEKYPNEEGVNLGSILIRSTGMLQGQIEELSMSKNNIASGLSITIIEKMEGIVQEL